MQRFFGTDYLAFSLTAGPPYPGTTRQSRKAIPELPECSGKRSTRPLQRCPGYRRGHRRELRLWASKSYKVLRFEIGDITVGKRNIDQSEQPAVLPQVQPLLLGDAPCDAVPGLRQSFVPVPGNLALFIVAHSARGATNQLHFIDLVGIPVGAEVGRRLDAKLPYVAESKWCHISPVRDDRRNVSRRSRTVLTGQQSRRPCSCGTRAIRTSPAEDQCGRSLADRHTARSRAWVRNLGERRRVRPFDALTL